MENINEKDECLYWVHLYIVFIHSLRLVKKIRQLTNLNCFLRLQQTKHLFLSLSCSCKTVDKKKCMVISWIDPFWWKRPQSKHPLSLPSSNPMPFDLQITHTSCLLYLPNYLSQLLHWQLDMSSRVIKLEHLKGKSLRKILCWQFIIFKTSSLY